MVVEEKVRVPTDFSGESHQKVVSFTCDGGKLVTGGSDGIVRVWQVGGWDIYLGNTSMETC